MRPPPLALHLGIVIVAKLLLLAALWLLFVRGDAVRVDPAAMAAHAGVSVLRFHLVAGEDRE